MSDIQFARVTSVRTQDGKVFVSTQPPRPGVEYRDIPLLKLFPGAMVTPQEGDIVAVHKLPDKSKVATMASSEPDDFSLPDLGQNEMCFRFSDGTEILIQKGSSGYTVDISGDEDVTITSETTVNVNAPSVKLGDETGTFRPVAREGDEVTVGSDTGTITAGSSSVEAA